MQASNPKITHVVVEMLITVNFAVFCLNTEILRHLYRFICTFLTKAACCRNIEIVQHPSTLSYI